MTWPSVNLWRSRSFERVWTGWRNNRLGRPASVHQRAVTANTTSPPTRLGVTYWSSQLLAAQAQPWHRHQGVKASGTPWRAETFRSSADSELVDKMPTWLSGAAAVLPRITPAATPGLDLVQTAA